LPALLAACVLVLGCGSPPAAPASVTLRSERGLVEASIGFDGPVRRGDNKVIAELWAPAGGEPRLAAVNAYMVAHNHQAQAASIRSTDVGFEASDLDLFMTGRWQLELELTLDDQSDRISMPVDVP
jgi:hypothetical protein